MPKKSGKQSKRVSCRKRYKIIKKVAEHNRKMRREAKKNPKKKARKDPGVPNSAPFKEDILREAEQRKERAQDLKQEQKAKRLKLKMQNRGLDETADKADSENEGHENPNHISEGSQLKKSGYNFRQLKSVIENADVILEVLDARDPLGSRCPQIEELVISSGKKLLLVLNKIDLIPRKNLNDWLIYLRKSLPTVAFKASTQPPKSKPPKGNRSRSKMPAIKLNENLQSYSICFGASFLMKVLGNYCKNQNIQDFIKVGVIGFPNVGKSSVINSLKQSRACSVETTPDLTKSAQEVSLDKHIKILDSPGVILAKSDSSAILALRNAVKVGSLKDVITPAEEILKRADHVQLCLHYTVPKFSSPQELFCNLAQRMGKYKKGGIPNDKEGAKRLISDWSGGSIKYFTEPPEEQETEYIKASIVQEFSELFDVSAEEEAVQIDKSPELFPSKGVLAKPLKTTNVVMSDEEEEENMEMDDCGTNCKEKVTVSFDLNAQSEPKSLPDEQQENKPLKKKRKRSKTRTRLQKAAVSETMDSSMTL